MYILTMRQHTGSLSQGGSKGLIKPITLQLGAAPTIPSLYLLKTEGLLASAAATPAHAIPCQYL
jgi:hypothetical protein